MPLMGGGLLAHHTRALGVSAERAPVEGTPQSWDWERSRSCGCSGGWPSVKSSRRGEFHSFLCSRFECFGGSSEKEAVKENQGAGTQRWMLASADPGDPGDRGLWLCLWQERLDLGVWHQVPGTALLALSLLGAEQHPDVVWEPLEGTTEQNKQVSLTLILFSSTN